MATKEEKQKLVDILSGKDFKWKVRVRKDFQRTSDSIDNFVFKGQGEGDLYVEYIILAKDESEATQRAQDVFYDEFNQSAEIVSIEECDGD
jgi:hypothetical protein